MATHSDLDGAHSVWHLVDDVAVHAPYVVLSDLVRNHEGLEPGGLPDVVLPRKGEKIEIGETLCGAANRTRLQVKGALSRVVSISISVSVPLSGASPACFSETEMHRLQTVRVAI